MVCGGVSVDLHVTELGVPIAPSTYTTTSTRGPAAASCAIANASRSTSARHAANYGVYGAASVAAEP